MTGLFVRRSVTSRGALDENPFSSPTPPAPRVHRAADAHRDWISDVVVFDALVGRMRASADVQLIDAARHDRASANLRSIGIELIEESVGTARTGEFSLTAAAIS
jgi:hypothetical protein